MTLPEQAAISNLIALKALHPGDYTLAIAYHAIAYVFSLVESDRSDYSVPLLIQRDRPGLIASGAIA